MTSIPSHSEKCSNAPVLYAIGFILSASASRQAPACCAYRPRILQTIFLLRRHLYCNTRPHLIALFEFPPRRQQLPSVPLSFNNM
ncbi:hypothetical protein K443DRAFT_127583 [Laccaria amethystina LaAM-08-1]|uniref:Uncharacterized protein n=1 Tax=Laccaria amethystina LaAM-08-1 TaxID=1095629 RepID=A0A0C9XA27_9AGAR|nr:hypothetical protein K443DRAFT_127583 [Laccaria amethystina LaAM-08-1]